MISDKVFYRAILQGMEGKTVVMVSNNRDLLQYFDRAIEVEPSEKVDIKSDATHKQRKLPELREFSKKKLGTLESVESKSKLGNLSRSQSFKAQENLKTIQTHHQDKPLVPALLAKPSSELKLGLELSRYFENFGKKNYSITFFLNLVFALSCVGMSYVLGKSSLIDLRTFFVLFAIASLSTLIFLYLKLWVYTSANLKFGKAIH